MKARPTTKYEATQAEKKAAIQRDVSPEKRLETHTDIEGLAPTDLQVAAYIEHLENSNLWENVILVESREHKIESSTFRQFKLKTMLKKAVHLTKGDINKIRGAYEKKRYNF